MNTSKATEFRVLQFPDQKEARSLIYFNLKYWMCLPTWALWIAQEIKGVLYCFQGGAFKGIWILEYRPNVVEFCTGFGSFIY